MVFAVEMVQSICHRDRSKYLPFRWVSVLTIEMGQSIYHCNGSEYLPLRWFRVFALEMGRSICPCAISSLYRDQWLEAGDVGRGYGIGRKSPTCTPERCRVDVLCVFQSGSSVISAASVDHDETSTYVIGSYFFYARWHARYCPE